MSTLTVTASNTGIAQDAINCDGQAGPLSPSIMAFIGATMSVNLKPNQVMKVSGTVNLGADPGTPVSNLTMNVCYRPSTDVIVSDIDFMGDVLGNPAAVPPVLPTPLSLAGGTFVPFTLTKSLTACAGPNPPAGSSCLPVDPAGRTYFVGLCGCIRSTAPADPWVSDFSWLTVQVSQQ